MSLSDDIQQAPLHHGLHVWLTEEMGFTHDAAMDQYDHPMRNICVSGLALRAATIDCLDADDARALITDLFFESPPRG